MRHHGDGNAYLSEYGFYRHTYEYETADLSHANRRSDNSHSTSSSAAGMCRLAGLASDPYSE